MPIYLLKCNDCGDEFEDFRNIKDQEERGVCIACGSKCLERVHKLELECDCGCGGHDHGPGQGCC